MKKTILIVTLTLIVCSLFSQNLKRRASLGAALININDSIAKVNNLKNNEGCIINSISENSSAKQLKLEVGDVIQQINNKKILDRKDLISMISTLKENDTVKIIITRKGKENTINGQLLGAKLDNYSYADVIYSEVPFEKGFLRNIIIKPKGNGKFPVVFFVQGYNCASIDNMGESHPYEKILMGLVQKGFAVCKVEKPGMGDCDGTKACREIDFKTELLAFDAAYNVLNTFDCIDTSKIYIFGHSMGGIIAPLMTTKIKPRGIAVYGTVTRSWFEYFVEQMRIQNFIMGEDYVQNDSAFNTRLQLCYDFMINKKTPKQLNENPAFKTQWEYVEPDLIMDRNYLYWQQLQDYSMINGWKNYDGKVLSIWGECDFVAFSRYDHELIAEISNKYHPGNGVFITIPNCDHAFTRVDNMKHAAEKWSDWSYRSKNFNSEIINVLVDWMQKLN